jgi:hemerythrin
MSAEGENMAFIKWKNSYSVNVIEFDQQHRRLIDIINRLHEAMKRGGTPDEVGRTVTDLLAYTSLHFRYEEELLARTGYPDLAAHKKVHRAMEGQVEKFSAEVASGRASLPLQLMSFLKDWLTRHILETDMRYTEHVTRARTA